MKYTNAKYFMEYEYRQSHVLQKTEYIHEFFIAMEHSPSVVENFDEEASIDKYILDYIEKKEGKANERVEDKQPEQQPEHDGTTLPEENVG